MPGQFYEHEMVMVPADMVTVVLEFEPAMMQLQARPAGQVSTEVQMNIPLYDFLMKLALEGPDAEQGCEGILWQFKHMAAQ